MNRIEEGIQSYRKVTEMEPEDPEIWLELSLVYSGQKQYELAIETLKEGLKWHEQNPDFHYGLATYLLKSGKVKQAYEMLAKALHMDYDGHLRLFRVFPELRNNKEITALIESFREKR
jgi:tetratricopeptide (TPR) repeat protein